MIILIDYVMYIIVQTEYIHKVYKGVYENQVRNSP